MMLSIEKYFYFQYERLWIEHFYSLKNGDIYIDCGAYLGEFLPYACKKVGNTGSVFALEPNPSLFNKVNYENTNLTKLQLAVSSKSDKIVKISNDQHFSSILPTDKQTTFQVKTISIADLIEKYKIFSIALIKMNIEGAEIEAVKGMLHVTNKINNITISGHVVNNINSVYPISEMLHPYYHVKIKQRIFGKKEHLDLYATKK